MKFTFYGFLPIIIARKNNIHKRTFENCRYLFFDGLIHEREVKFVGSSCLFHG